jgi:hypothetical protein
MKEDRVKHRSGAKPWLDVQHRSMLFTEGRPLSKVYVSLGHFQTMPQRHQAGGKRK